MSATLESLGELRIAERIRERLGAVPAAGDVGPGDDAAVLQVSGDRIVLTVDTLREGVHFQRHWLAPEAIGRRALAIAVSDLAAMGAAPLCALCSAVLPPETGVAWFDGLIDGLAAAGEEFGCPVVGGDVSQPAPAVSLCVTAVGTLAPGDRAARRSGARPGDVCMVVGALGRAAAGRELLASGTVPRSEAERACVEAFRRPVPRIAVGRELAPLVHAMMDVSDGLTLDLERLCRASGTGAELDAAALSDPLLSEAVAGRDADPLELMLRGGDDYALLLAVDAADVSRVVDSATGHGTEARVIGRFEERPGLRLVTDEGVIAIEPGGWDPFSGEADA